MISNSFRNTFRDTLDLDRASLAAKRRVSGPLMRHGYKLEEESNAEITYTRRYRPSFRVSPVEKRVRIRFRPLEDGSMITVEGEIDTEGQRDVVSALIAY